MEIKEQIEVLKAKSKGNLFEDLETHQKIYDLKKQLTPEIVDNPELDDDFFTCEACGS